MRAEVQDIGPCRKKLVIELEPEEVKAAIEANIGELRRNAILPGFRRGHAPIELVEKRFGSDIRKEVKTNLVIDNYRKAVEEHKIEPISDPDVDIDAVEMKDGEGLRYELTVEVWPEFKAEGYEGLNLEKPSAEPTEEETEAEIQGLRMRTTTFEEIEEAGAEETDFVMASYTVKADEKEVASAEEAGVRPADSVVGRMKVEGLKEALLGKKAGEAVELQFKIDAEHYEEELRGKDAVLSLKIKGIRRPRVPEATEAWAKDLGFESLDELKEVITRNVAAAKESRAEEALKAQVHEKLLEKIAFELPEEAVRRQRDDIMKREQLGLRYRGATEEDLAKINDKLSEASLERATRDLKLFFILSRIAEKEEIRPTEADVEMRIAEMAARYRTSTAKMRDRLKNEDMLGQIALSIREEKTISHILSKAVIAEAAAAAEKAEAKPKKPRVARTKKAGTDSEAREKPEGD